MTKALKWYAVTMEPGARTKRTLWLTDFVLGMPSWGNAAKAKPFPKRKAIALARKYSSANQHCGWEEIVTKEVAA